MNIDITSLIVSFISCAVFIKLLMPFAVRINLVDNPDHRKMHTGKIPLVGGLAIFLAIIIGMLTTQVDLNQYRGILLSILIIVVVGIVDDQIYEVGEDCDREGDPRCGFQDTKTVRVKK